MVFIDLSSLLLIKNTALFGHHTTMGRVLKEQVLDMMGGRESLRQVRSPPPEDWMPLCILVC